MEHIGGADHIKKHLENIERNIELNTKDPVLRGGFTQVPLGHRWRQDERWVRGTT